MRMSTCNAELQKIKQNVVQMLVWSADGDNEQAV